MSFSSNVKAELCQVKIEKSCCALAECYGILLYCSCFSASEIRVTTSSPEFSLLLPKLFKRTFGFNFDVLPENDAEGKRSFLITDRTKIASIFNRFGQDAEHALTHHINLAVIEDDCCKRAFIRGAFLAGGSVTDPEKSFHLELATSHRSVSREAHSILLDLEFMPRESERKNNCLLYFKKADTIADLLTSIGSSKAGMNIATAKIEKEMRNSTVRQVNCDMANADKIVSASQEQIDAIHRYAARYGLDTLPENLKDTAYLRITNPEVSLSDLSRLSSPHVSKSTLSYRLKKIEELARLDEPVE